MSDTYPKIQAIGRVGNRIVCPGCGERVTLTPFDGWRNDKGYSCNPPSSTHHQHIDTVQIR